MSRHDIDDVLLADVAADSDDVADARAQVLAETAARLDDADKLLTLDDVRHVLRSITADITTGRITPLLARRIAAASA
ncbi:MAG: hypothetical protein OXC62_02610 [Aestuariivita sp.]|nr:hypothetical protein [Aestuariivita sp.]